MERITSKISGDAETLYLKGEDIGVYTYYDGTDYYYDITKSDTFGITKIAKIRKEVIEVADERQVERIS